MMPDSTTRFNLLITPDGTNNPCSRQPAPENHRDTGLHSQIKTRVVSSEFHESCALTRAFEPAGKAGKSRRTESVEYTLIGQPRSTMTPPRPPAGPTATTKPPQTHRTPTNDAVFNGGAGA